MTTETEEESPLTRLTKEQVIQAHCKIGALVYHSIRDYSEPNDGFCSECDKVLAEHNWNFRNCGDLIGYIRRAVLNQMKLDGIKISPHFSTETGALNEDAKDPAEAIVAAAQSKMEQLYPVRSELSPEQSGVG